MPEDQETAIVITVPDTGDPWPTQVLVRLPGHVKAEDIQVDFRPEPQASWQPAGFFGNAVSVRHQ